MSNFNIDYLVVAGGGGGGGCSSSAKLSGAGGGAGGMRTSFGAGNVNGGLTSVESTLSLTYGNAYSVTVGAGGAGMIDTDTQTAYGYQGVKGSDSIFNTITSTGGGGGGAMGPSPFQDASSKGGIGGSGGGSGFRNGPTGTGSAATPYNASPVQGFIGGGNLNYTPGYATGGGGGAGGAGGLGGPSPNNGAGGLGLQNAITGTNSFYAGGGGGSTYRNAYRAPGPGGSGIGGDGGGAYPNTAGVGGNGVVNTGSGGGGGNAGTGSVAMAGGSGGSGVVILRYATANTNYTTTGITPTETTDGTDTILSFTTVGTGTITFTTPPPPFSGTKVTTPVTDFNKLNTEEGLKIPSGTSSNQPTGVEGMIRNDTTQSSNGSSSAISFYNGTNWRYFENELNTSFNTVLYNGNGSTNSITGVGFQPDLVWIKSRDTAYDHRLFDSVRGLSTDGILYSNLTNAAKNLPSINDNFVSLDANGFTLGSTSSTNGSNFNGDSFVAWCWKAGGPAVSNTDGSITSQVSANNDLGFSIAKYTGNLTSATTATGQSVGHGMDVPPELIIFKSTSNSTSWDVFSSELDNWSTRVQLNSTGQKNNLYAQYPIANPTSGVFYTNYLSAVNVNNYDHIAYCFTSKPNYSKIGTYLGNGNTTGPIVTLGFEPAFVMIKGVDEVTGWTMLDNKRDTSNPNSARLDADDAMAEFNGSNLMDFNSDSFQLKTSSAGQNANGKTFIYLAFANTI